MDVGTPGENYHSNSSATIHLNISKTFQTHHISSFSQYFIGSSSGDSSFNLRAFFPSHYSFSWPISKMPIMSVNCFYSDSSPAYICKPGWSSVFVTYPLSIFHRYIKSTSNSVCLWQRCLVSVFPLLPTT